MKIDKFVVTDVSQSVCVLFINSRDAIKKVPSKLEGVGGNVKGMKSGQGDFGGCKMV